MNLVETLRQLNLHSFTYQEIALVAKELRDDTIVELYSDGMNKRKIASTVGVDTGTVRRVLHKEFCHTNG